MSNPKGSLGTIDESQLQNPVDVLNIVLDHIPQRMVVVGPDYRLLAFNQRFTSMMRLPEENLKVGTDFRDLVRIWAAETGQDKQMLDLAIKELDKTESFEFEFPQLVGGDINWVLLTHTPLPGGGFVRTFTDITKHKALEASLLKLSREDPLTSLFNRRTLMEVLEDEMRRSQRYSRPMSILLMDIDHFKKVNDQWGHPTGDAVLRAFAAECKEMMRENDKIGRWGGEEFVMMLPETERSDAVQVANRLRELTAAMAIHTGTGNELIHVTVSIGIASSKLNDTVDALISRADQAMYEAKNIGRDRVVCG